MADEPKEAEEGEEAPAKGGVLPWILVTLLCGGAGVAIPFLIPTSASDVAPDLAAEEEKFEPPPIDEMAYVQFESIVVNINQDNLTRYLRIGMSLGVAKTDKDEIEKMITDKMPVLKSWVLGNVGDMSLEEVRGSPGRNRIAREIKDEFNSILFPDGNERIYAVLLDEYAVQ